ncbi:PqqD family protein [Ponticoccus sp. SC6-36]|nr:PqqD family protein [Ponticoccus sp. SC6-36]
MARPVRVTGRATLVDAFIKGMKQTVLGWSDAGASEGPPFCTVTAHPAGYTVASDYLETPLCDLPLASAVCAVIADLAEAYLEAHCDMRALHCGAVRISGRMVLFSGVGHAGKSTLMARLSMEPGVRVFCDDILPIRADATAVALGVPPRVRLPLPASGGAAFDRFVQQQGGLRDASYAYVPGPAILPHGSEGRPDALLLLRRESGATARLHDLSAQAAAANMLAQDMSLQADGIAHIDRVTAMAEAMWRATLVYDDLNDAVRLLADTFALPDLGAAALADPIAADPPRAKPAAIDPKARWQRHPDVGLRSRLGAAFLWVPWTGRYFHLNAIAMVCWTLIEAPMTADDIVLELTELFPDAPPQQVRVDVANWLAEMIGNGLVLEP